MIQLLSSFDRKSTPMRKIYDLIEMVSNTSSNVLITGESGTGKELVAKAIHYSGIRKDAHFVAIPVPPSRKRF